jgi:flagellar biosynthesis/type III secretory pathway ATPase
MTSMPGESPLGPYLARLEACGGLRWQGRVTQVVGPLVESVGPFCSVGEICQIVDSRKRVLPGEIVGFRGETVLSMPLESPRGIRYGDQVITWGERATLRVGDQMLGRVIDGSGAAARFSRASQRTRFPAAGCGRSASARAGSHPRAARPAAFAPWMRF